MVEGNIHHAEKNVPKLWELVKGGKIFAIGNEKTLILGAKGDGTLSFATGTKGPGDWIKDIDFSNKEQVFSWFKTTFPDWGHSWHELFDADDAWYIPRPMYHFPLDQCWTSKPNLTMIGDAAHRMPPYAGEGVNQAMQDALELYEELCEKQHSTLYDAIASFEKKMCERTGKITDESLRSTEMMHAPDGLNNMLRFFRREEDVL
jgi:2-polyprenyl-6-methoxyphenol hydroxylase-like FAD-dependent oxidoreductase